MRFHLTPISKNIKTGPIPVTTSSGHTCPDACPLKKGGCYAKSGPLSIHWSQVTKADRGLEWTAFLDKLSVLPRGQLWRHNQAGDLPGFNNEIDAGMLAQLVETNRKLSLHGFTYTHKPMTLDNQAAVKDANDKGFTINLSADTLHEADELAALNVGPVVVVMPHDGTPTETPEGRKVIICPAQTHDRMDCANCKLCSNAKREVIIGFLAHGTGSGIVERRQQELIALEQKQPASPPAAPKPRATTPRRTSSKQLPVASWPAS